MKKNLLILFLLLSAPAWGSDLEGVYEFVRLETPQGPQADQKGMLVAAGGYLCHLRVSKERPTFERGETDEARNQKAAELFRAANATCGKFTLEENKIEATWSVSLDPRGDGNTSSFLYRLEEGHLYVAPAAAPEFQFVYRKLK